MSDTPKILPRKEWKIVAYNLNGSRAAVRKGLIDYLDSEKAHAYLFSETRAKIAPPQLKDYAKNNNYRIFWNAAVKNPGYSGTSIMISETLLRKRQILVYYPCLLAKKKQDGLMTIEDMFEAVPSPNKVSTDHTLLYSKKASNATSSMHEGRMTVVLFDRTAILAFYAPNSGAILARLPEKLQWLNNFSKLCSSLQEKGYDVISGGDVNVARLEKDVYDGSYNRMRKLSAGFTDEERGCLTGVLSITGMADVVDVLEYIDEDMSAQDKIDAANRQMTFRSYRGPYDRRFRGLWDWRIDAFYLSRVLVTPNENRPTAISIKPRQRIEVSDHCPLVLTMMN